MKKGSKINDLISFHLKKLKEQLNKSKESIKKEIKKINIQ